MTEPIQFDVPAVPVAQPRQRVAVIGGHARAYTPTRAPVNAFKAAVQLAAETAYTGPPLEGPLWLLIRFVMPRPNSMRWKRKPMPRVHDTRKKNDWDNLGKSVCDALNKRLWTDDGVLSIVTVERWVASGEEQPHVEIMLGEC